MTLGEFCVLQQADGSCGRGRPTPKKMKCVDFAPGIERFCSTPADYAGQEQLKQMSLFFGLAGKELKRILAMGEDQRGNPPSGGGLPAAGRRSLTRLA